MRKTMSLKQVAANQRNALKSTGPKTAEGRAVSRMNALKHGILSKQVLVRSLSLRENPRELEAMHQRFWEELQPVGPVEEMLVDQIVTTQWRLRRALTAESGEIGLSVGKYRRDGVRGTHPQLLWSRWELLGDPIWSMQDSVEGNRLLERWLEDVRAKVEQEGGLSEATIQELVGRFGGKPNSLTRQLDELRQELQEKPDGPDEAALRERNKSAALKFLNRELSMIRWLKDECEKRERNKLQAQQAAAVLPSIDVLDKILRYETKLERQMYRAMAQLERLQRMRQGEAVPAPLSVEVSERA